MAPTSACASLTARAYPEVWPGWRGNALIGDFYRDFLQPGAPVLTALTVMMGEAADGERAFLKSARATQQAGTGIARYLPGLPEKARDWRFVTERLKEGERLVRACYAICVYATPEAMDEAEQAVRAIYHGQGWRLGAERYAHLPAWLSCLPMTPAGGLDSDLARLGRMKTLLTSSVVNLAPVHGEWRGQRPNSDAPARSPSRGQARPARPLVPVRERGGKLQRGRHGEVGFGQIRVDAGTRRRYRRRGRRGRRHRRRAILPAYGRGARRRLHRLRQGPGAAEPLRHDRQGDRSARRRLQGGVLRHAGLGGRPDVPEARSDRRRGSGSY